MKITIQATTAEISPEEVKSYLSADQLKRAKGKTLVPYTIVEEGESRPRVIGEGSKVLNWSRAVIHRVSQVLKPGTKLFNGHNEDNSTNGRRSVGEVLTKFTQEVGGKLRTVAIACMEKADAIAYDVCSIEAEVQEQNGYVGDVSKITGIAVSNSKIDTPAFANAKRMRIVQCFDSHQEDDKNSRKESKTMITLEDLMTAPIGLIQQAVTARQMHPNQLFNVESMRDDKEFGAIFKEREEFGIKNKELETKLVEKDTLLKETTKKATIASATEMLTKQMPEKMTDLQKTFTTDNFNPETLGEVTEDSVNKYIESSKQAFQKQAELFGYKLEGEENVEGESDGKEASTLEDAFDEE